jgi:hypothetical protein
MNRILIRGAVLSVAAMAFMGAGGCATTESVEHAQATADQALSAAQAAKQEADQNRTDINSMQQEMQEMKTESHTHHGERG